MKAPDIVESWKWRDPEEIIDRLLSRSERAPSTERKRKRKPKTKADTASVHREEAMRLFRKDPVITRKCNARRKAAMEAAANDPFLARRSQGSR